MTALPTRSSASRRLALLLPWLLAAAALLPAGVARAESVRASPAQVSQLLFVAGDVQRLSRNPSGTVDTLLEKTLQQLYRDEPGLDADAAVQEIERLRAALPVSREETSPATLAAQPGNQRVITILARLRESKPSRRVARALTAVADQALTESSRTARAPGGRLQRGRRHHLDAALRQLLAAAHPARHGRAGRGPSALRGGP